MPLKFWNTGSYEDHQLSFNRKIKDIIALGNMFTFHSSTNIYRRVILHVKGIHPCYSLQVKVKGIHPCYS